MPAPTTIRLLRWSLSALVLLWLSGPYWPWTVDDVYITVGFARQWAESGALTWTDGARVEGYSNFLLVALLSLGMRLGADGGLLSQVVALLCGLGVLGLASRTLPTSALGTAALLGLAACNPLCRWSVVGMETTLYALLIAAGWSLSLQGDERAPWRWSAGLALLSLASLTRPEGAALVCLALLLRLRLPRRLLSQDIAVIAVIVALGAYHAGRVVWFGHLLPTPVIVKITDQPWLWNGMVQGAADMLTAAGVLAAAFFATKPGPLKAILAAVPLLLQMAVLVRAGGDWMAHARILLPGVVATVVALGSVRQQTPPQSRVWTWGLCLLGMAVGAAVESTGWKTFDLSFRNAWGLERPLEMFSMGLDTPFELDLAWMVEHIPPGTEVYLSDVGMLSQIEGVPIIDLGGLVNRHVAERRPSQAVLPWMVAHMERENGPAFVLRVADQREADVWPVLPPSLDRLLHRIDTTQTGSTFTQWSASSSSLSEPSPEQREARWETLMRRHPHQPSLRWMAAQSRARLGDSLGAAKIVHAARARWPRDPRFAEGLSGISFVEGSVPLYIEKNRGFAMYTNGTLVSRPLQPAERRTTSLIIDGDDLGEEGAHLLIQTQPPCHEEQIIFHKKEMLSVDFSECQIEQSIIISISFQNDAASKDFDRNVYLKLLSGEPTAE